MSAHLPQDKSGKKRWREMTVNTNRPIIIKRKKVIGGDGHHGGAWKVAYADFVTAMMAFFMLMWLLNATTEQQRKGIADYFSPTIPINRVSGGGDGALGASDIFSTDSLAQTGTGGVAEKQGDSTAQSVERAVETAKLQDLEAALLGIGGETMLADNMLRHVVTRSTDEGLIIELFDLPGAALFDGDTIEPSQIAKELVAVLSRVLAPVENNIAIVGHVRAQSILRIDYPVWELSTQRAGTIRTMMVATGTDPVRMVRQTGEADRQSADADPQALRNNRIELIVLRSDAERR